MNEEALLYSFELFSKDGYEGSIEDYKELIKTNEEALKHSYDLFSKDGYEGDEYKFQNLVGVEPVKTEAVATETAPVTAGNQAVDTGLESEDISLESQPTDPFVVNGKPVTEEEYKKAEAANYDDKTSYLSKLWTDINKGSSSLGEMMASIPETIYDIFAIPQNIVAKITGNDSISASSKKFKKITGISNPILDFYEKESEALGKVQDIYNNKNYEYQGIYKNFKNGNYLDAFKQMGSGIAESAPVSISMMVGGAATTAGKLAAGSTVAMAGPEIKNQLENEAQSSLASIVKGIGLAGAESVFSSIGTGTLGKVYKDILLKEGKEEGVKIFRNGLIEMYATALKKAGAPAAMVGEGIEEVATTITQNMINGVGAFDNVADSFIQGVGGGSLYGAPINVSKAKKAVQEGIVNVKINRNIKDSEFTNATEPFASSDVSKLQLDILKNKGAFQLINSKVDREVLGGRLSKEDGDKIKTNIIETQGSINTIDKTNITNTDKVAAVNLLKEKRETEQKIKSINDSSLTQTESDRIKVINEELNSLVQKGNISKSSANLGENIKSIEKLAGDIKGVNIKPLDNAKAIDDYIKDNNLDIDKKASEQQGFIFQNKETGEQTIIINKDVAAKERAVNVAAHEFLHALLFQTVKDSPTTQVSLGNSLKSYLDKVDADQVKDSNFAKRLDQYKQDPNNVKAEEVITLFSDALATGDIKFNENVFTKIGDVIRRALQSVGVSVKFNDGKDVYNFVKDYNKSVSKGKLTKAQIKASKGVKGSLVAEGVTTASKTDTKLSKSNKELGNEIKALVPEGTSKSRYDNQVIGNVYEKLVFGKTLDGLINGQLNKYGVVGDNVYGKPKDIFLEDVKAQLYEKSLMRFNPETNDDLGGFVVNELIKYRIGDVVNRYKKEAGVEGKSLDVAAGEVGSVQEVADESMSIEDQIDLEATQARSETRLTKATKIMSKEQYDKAAKMVEEKLKDIDPKKLSYKKIGGLATDVLSEITDVPAGKILDSTKNLSKEETSRGAMFIEKNIDYIRKTLPKGAVQEAATEKLMGTATGVANSILKRLYDKNPRIKKGAGLSPWSIKPGLTNQDILDAIGRPKREDGRKIQINPRSPEGQVIKGILNLVDRNIANELARTVESDLTLEQKQDIAAGKSDVMFSKSVEGFDTMYNIAFSRRNSIELNEEYGFKSNWYDLDVMAKDWPDTEAKFLKDYEKFVSSTAIGGFRPDFFISSKNTLNPNSKPGDKFYEEAHAKRKATRAKIELINEKYNLNKIGFNSPPSIYGKTVNKIIQGIKNGKINEANQKYGEIFDKTWISIAKLAREDKKMIPFILHFMETAGNTSHWHRLGAEFIAYDVNPKKVIKSFTKNGKKVSYEIYYEYEHAVQSHIAAKILLNAAFDKSVNFQAVLRDIKENYKLIALSLEDAGKLNKAGYALKMPKGWKHWWERYFNNEVASISGGINPDNIKGINNIELSKELRVTSNGVKFSKSLNLDKEFNDIIENKTGIESYKNYKKVKAQVTGASKGRFNFFIAPSAEDFVGLLYKTLGKGKIGDAQMAWYKENLLDPYARAMEKVSRDRNFMARNFLAIKKELKIVPKNLKKKIPGEPFTQEQAIRVYIWNKKGSTIPEISENDSIYLTNFVENNEKLKTFADQVIALSGIEDYAKPSESWVTGTITTDMLEALNTTKRAKYLELWQQNADEIFSEKNLNKLEAAFGADYKEAMKNILKRMKTGRNRAFGGDSLTGRFVDWMTGATGAIMFFNTRSAVLQTLSAVNFINFGDNNIFAASKAFANQKQYWSDFKMLFNSEFLVERRDGLKINVNEADIADIAKEKGVRGLINKLLKLGFTPTQLADSFAIATGGATFYRNRLKALIKDGMDPVAAEKQAMRDFRETAEESQQSSRPDKISAQQAGPLGRTILAFANTPAQYARIIKKAASDIKNGRGDLKTNISKIMYYGVAQNLIFNALQQALFAALFDEDEEEVDDKTISIANGMADSILRGIGISGAIISVVKNAAMRWVKEEEKSNPKYENAILELVKISPPVSSKINKLRAAARSYSWDKDEMKEGGLSIDNPANLAIGNVVSAVTNIPLDRVVKKMQHIKTASDSEIETYKRIFLLAGWSKWELGIKEPSKKKKKKRRVKIISD